MGTWSDNRILENLGIAGARLQLWWAAIRDSLWFTPAILTVAAVGLASITLRLDESALARDQADVDLIFGAGAEGARAVLSTIAGGIITVTGVVFSVTIVALQLASSQFTPRVLRNFMADRANQTVLGVFIGTFTYAILILKEVEAATEETDGFVPVLSVTVALVLVMVSIGFLIFFIDHVARTIHASTIIDRVTNDTLFHVRRLFPEPIGKPADGDLPDIMMPTTEPGTILTDETGYLQSIDDDALFRLARKGRLTIRMEPFISEFLLPHSVLVSIWPASAAADRDVVAGVRKAFVIGRERSLEQDVEFGVSQLVDIAVKALSPSVNDPTTARMCIDRLGEILVVLGNRAVPNTLRTGEARMLLFVARRTVFEHVAELAFDDIRHFGVSTPSVARHLLRTLERVCGLVPPNRRVAIVKQANLVLAAARRDIDGAEVLARVEETGAWRERYQVQSAPGAIDRVA
jgi:uncharacterized membrane protein